MQSFVLVGTVHTHSLPTLFPVHDEIASGRGWQEAPLGRVSEFPQSPPSLNKKEALSPAFTF